jgi:hypothetical protein
MLVVIMMKMTMTNVAQMRNNSRIIHLIQIMKVYKKKNRKIKIRKVYKITTNSNIQQISNLQTILSYKIKQAFIHKHWRLIKATNFIFKILILLRISSFYLIKPLKVVFLYNLIKLTLILVH